MEIVLLDNESHPILVTQLPKVRKGRARKSDSARIILGSAAVRDVLGMGLTDQSHH